MFGFYVSANIRLMETGLITQGAFPLERKGVLVTVIVDEAVQLFVSQSYSGVVTWKTFQLLFSVVL